MSSATRAQGLSRLRLPAINAAMLTDRFGTTWLDIRHSEN